MHQPPDKSYYSNMDFMPRDGTKSKPRNSENLATSKSLQKLSCSNFSTDKSSKMILFNKGKQFDSSAMHAKSLKQIPKFFKQDNDFNDYICTGEDTYGLKSALSKLIKIFRAELTNYSNRNKNQITNTDILGSNFTNSLQL